MSIETKTHGHLMASESAEALKVFCQAATQTVDAGRLADAKAIYTIARGSSDAAANILSYELMRELSVPVTSLPPSVFSLGAGVNMDGAGALVISQSGASDDLVRAAKGARSNGADVVAITNQPDSPVEAASETTVPIGAGPELAVPATKTVIGSVAAGMALLGGIKPEYKLRAEASAEALRGITTHHPRAKALQAALLRARNVYVIGRDTGHGAAIEVALKLKECCALHAEDYSASEVLHGPLQLATNPLMVLILDTGSDHIQESLDKAEARFRAVGCDVHRISPADIGVSDLTPAAAAAVLLAVMYPVILNTALALGLDPDTPETLSKVTQTT
ncbi:glucosamine--fructose-6-phosphate aminotransferase [Aliiroseovarius zhejiangensis]|uniref:Glucosamine--fructose-6-phosphate aminotransferase n=1 Tax=Aliiroseovarius zhejiangensis TaxID=1632025 RepID=A0ABQ3IZT0_9RHOB|nr:MULTISPECIES: SIS domain-containing protein [Aliiroseovarius]MCK8485060.1 SIS domain-containing protein [Aliiroseovarius sp. S2029]GHE94239.1 glucosamine--fructose-6-phosphate aminotransferase [Aliiroseovarius zhejiangensis]